MTASAQTVNERSDALPRINLHQRLSLNLAAPTNYKKWPRGTRRRAHRETTRNEIRKSADIAERYLELGRTDKSGLPGQLLTILTASHSFCLSQSEANGAPGSHISSGNGAKQCDGRPKGMMPPWRAVSLAHAVN